MTCLLFPQGAKEIIFAVLFVLIDIFSRTLPFLYFMVVPSFMKWNCWFWVQWRSARNFCFRLCQRIYNICVHQWLLILKCWHSNFWVLSIWYFYQSILLIGRDKWKTDDYTVALIGGFTTAYTFTFSLITTLFLLRSTFDFSHKEILHIFFFELPFRYISNAVFLFTTPNVQEFTWLWYSALICASIYPLTAILIVLLIPRILMLPESDIVSIVAYTLRLSIPNRLRIDILTTIFNNIVVTQSLYLLHRLQKNKRKNF